MRYVLCYQNLLLNCHQFGDFGSRDRPPLLVRRPAFETISRPGPDAEDALSAKPASVREYGRAVDVYWATDADTLHDGLEGRPCLHGHAPGSAALSSNRWR